MTKINAIIPIYRQYETMKINFRQIDEASEMKHINSRLINEQSEMSRIGFRPVNERHEMTDKQQSVFGNPRISNWKLNRNRDTISSLFLAFAPLSLFLSLPLSVMLAIE